MPSTPSSRFCHSASMLPAPGKRPAMPMMAMARSSLLLPAVAARGSGVAEAVPADGAVVCASGRVAVSAGADGEGAATSSGRLAAMRAAKARAVGSPKKSSMPITGPKCCCSTSSAWAASSEEPPTSKKLSCACSRSMASTGLSRPTTCCSRARRAVLSTEATLIADFVSSATPDCIFLLESANPASVEVTSPPVTPVSSVRVLARFVAAVSEIPANSGGRPAPSCRGEGD